MEIDGAEWVTLREAEQIISRSRRQIWRYIYDGSWDTRAVIDDMNRQVTYIKLADILRKKTELESAQNLNAIPIAEKDVPDGLREEGETDLVSVQRLLECIIANQEHQGNLIKKCLQILEKINLTLLKAFMLVVLIGVVIVAVCSILSFIRG